MNLKFWGVRGSIPTPGIEYARYGGNTSCVELSIGDRTIIFDMGSGLKGLGTSIVKRKIKKFDILVSHFHYDHTCGLPFFEPAYAKEFEFTIRSAIVKTRKETRDVLSEQMKSPSFPITIDNFSAKIEYKDFEIEKDFFLSDDIKVKTIHLNHPDGATGYRVESKNKSVSYITDHEHLLSIKNKKLVDFLQGTDALIYDSTYDDNNFSNYIGWGHSTWQEAVRLAKASKVKKLFIYHHNPENNDKVMDSIQKKCFQINKNYLVAMEGKPYYI